MTSDILSRLPMDLLWDFLFDSFEIDQFISLFLVSKSWYLRLKSNDIWQAFYRRDIFIKSKPKFAKAERDNTYFYKFYVAQFKKQIFDLTKYVEKNNIPERCNYAEMIEGLFNFFSWTQEHRPTELFCASGDLIANLLSYEEGNDEKRTKIFRKVVLQSKMIWSRIEKMVSVCEDTSMRTLLGSFLHLLTQIAIGKQGIYDCKWPEDLSRCTIIKPVKLNFISQVKPILEGCLARKITSGDYIHIFSISTDLYALDVCETSFKGKKIGILNRYEQVISEEYFLFIINTISDYTIQWETKFVIASSVKCPFTEEQINTLIIKRRSFKDTPEQQLFTHLITNLSDLNWLIYKALSRFQKTKNTNFSTILASIPQLNIQIDPQ